MCIRDSCDPLYLLITFINTKYKSIFTYRHDRFYRVPGSDHMYARYKHGLQVKQSTDTTHFWRELKFYFNFDSFEITLHSTASEILLWEKNLLFGYILSVLTLTYPSLPYAYTHIHTESPACIFYNHTKFIIPLTLSWWSISPHGGHVVFTHSHRYTKCFNAGVRKTLDWFLPNGLIAVTNFFPLIFKFTSKNNRKTFVWSLLRS